MKEENNNLTVKYRYVQQESGEHRNLDGFAGVLPLKSYCSICNIMAKIFVNYRKKRNGYDFLNVRRRHDRSGGSASKN